eukprot:COSAG02_NODE_1598_length_11761_cov_15.902418_6_plen_55_part_00
MYFEGGWDGFNCIDKLAAFARAWVPFVTHHGYNLKLFAPIRPFDRVAVELQINS